MQKRLCAKNIYIYIHIYSSIIYFTRIGIVSLTAFCTPDITHVCCIIHSILHHQPRELRVWRSCVLLTWPWKRPRPFSRGRRAYCTTIAAVALFVSSLRVCIIHIRVVFRSDRIDTYVKNKKNPYLRPLKSPLHAPDIRVNPLDSNNDVDDGSRFPSPRTPSRFRPATQRFPQAYIIYVVTFPTRWRMNANNDSVRSQRRTYD